MKTCMISMPGSCSFDAPVLAVLERCQGAYTCFLIARLLQHSPGQGPSCPRHSQSTDRHWWRASLSGWLGGLRGSSVKGNSQWNAMATDILVLTLKSYLMLNSSVQFYLWLYTSDVNAAASKMT